MFQGRVARHSIEFVVVETKEIVGSNSNMILTQQASGQRSGMAAGGKRRGLAFYFSARICKESAPAQCQLPIFKRV